jgi:exopolysaccharide production protein ExoQ
MATSFLILAVGSLAMVVAIPRFGIDHTANAGDWRGLWIEKNTLALFMVPGGLAALSAAFQSPRRWWLWCGMLGLCLLLLLMSKGKTALLCFLIAMGLAAIIWLMRRGRIAGVLTLWASVTTAAIGGFILWQAPGLLLTAVGKDATLTGRTQIWTAVLAQVAQRPLTGFGFAAFWEKTSVPAMVIRAQTHWTVPTAHNGWLDLLVQVGWVGVGLFAAVFALTLVAAAVRTARTREYFGLIFLVIFGVFSLTESFLEQHNSLFWALFVTAMTHALSPVKARRRSAAAPVFAARRPPGLRLHA